MLGRKERGKPKSGTLHLDPVSLQRLRQHENTQVQMIE